MRRWLGLDRLLRAIRAVVLTRGNVGTKFWLDETHRKQNIADMSNEHD